MEGMVVNVQKGLYTVRPLDGSDAVGCTLRGKLLNQSRTAKSLVVVGDQVDFEPVVGGRGVITTIKTRRTRLVRRGAGKKGRHLEQVIAANIDIAVLVFAVKDPPYKTSLIERYIYAARSGNIEPVICLNKVDLIVSEVIENDVELFRSSGNKVLITSTVRGDGIEELREVLREKVSVFAGSSGVGKSSLVNALFMQSVAKTGQVSGRHHKGRHTTSFSQVYDLPAGGKVIDIPGMREFGVFGDGSAAQEAFPDIEKIAEKCRFRDCSHKNEPECAVKAAVTSGELDERRFRSYLRLIDQF